MVDTERVSAIAEALVPEGESLDKYYAQMLRQQEAEVPLGYVAEAGEIARVAAFLASSESAYLTGVSISVTGGVQLG